MVTKGAKYIIIVHCFLQSKSFLLYLLVKLLSMDIFTIDFIISIGLLVCWPCVFPFTVKPLYWRQHWDLKIVSVIERYAVIRHVHYRDVSSRGDVNWDLKIMSSRERFPLCVLYIEVLLWELTIILSVPGKSVHCREVSALNYVRYKEVSLYSHSVWNSWCLFIQLVNHSGCVYDCHLQT